MIADVKPPVIPDTADGAKVRLRVPVVIEPPDVFDAVAVRAANTFDETMPAPPTAAVTTIVTLSAMLPAPFDNAADIGFMMCSLPSLVFLSR